MKTKILHLLSFLLCIFYVGCEKDYNPTTGKSGGGISDVVDDSSIDYPEGAICGVFYVSQTKKVAFSKGNLRYKESTKKWRFAEEQWLTSESANKKEDKTAWIDLFQWGNNTPYTDSYSHEFKDLNSETDWGKCNKIENGGNEVGLWRTLTVDEWDYLIKNHKNGWVKIYTDPNSSNYDTYYYYLPDSWTGEGEMPSSSISISEWKEYEDRGAVLLASYVPYYYYSDNDYWIRYGNTFECSYWSASYVDEDHAYTSGGSDAYKSTPKDRCCAVRLVCDLK